MKNKVRYCLFLCLGILHFQAVFSSTSACPGNPDTSRKAITVSKTELVFLVDSLLELDSIGTREIGLVKYYNDLLNNTAKTSTQAPGAEYYADFDESKVFTITPENEFPEQQELILQNDSLGYYFHPHLSIITSKFGWRDGRMHKGMDIELDKGTPVHAAFNGMVRYAKREGAYGNVIIIRHYNGLETVYAHLSKIKVKPGEIIKAGQLIGLGGSTGRSSGPHLHFEVRFKGHALNPSGFISFEDGKLQSDVLTIKKSRWGITAYPANSLVYTIQKGDSWFEVAKRYGISVKQLCTLNGTQKRYYLRVGQQLRIN